MYQGDVIRFIRDKLNKQREAYLESNKRSPDLVLVDQDVFVAIRDWALYDLKVTNLVYGHNRMNFLNMEMIGIEGKDQDFIAFYQKANFAH
jgi:hypothetical protein